MALRRVRQRHLKVTLMETQYPRAPVQLAGNRVHRLDAGCDPIGLLCAGLSHDVSSACLDHSSGIHTSIDRFVTVGNFTPAAVGFLVGNPAQSNNHRLSQSLPATAEGDVG
jgi:hypothetical protein